MEGVGAEGVALHFLGFAVFLVPVPGGALLVRFKKVGVGVALLFSSSSYISGLGRLVSSLVLFLFLLCPFFS